MYTPSDDDVLLLRAAANGDLQLLQQLQASFGDDEYFRRRCGICKDWKGRTALHLGAREGRIQICRFLIENVTVDINVKSEKGETPLLYAVVMGHFSIAKYLIIRGAEITASDSEGKTSLHYAAGKDNKELMQMLLLRGADIESNSVRGTPLQWAAAHGKAESVRFLLGRGAEPNAVSLLCHSPLMWALSSRSSECLELLLEAGANPDITSCGSSPLACAAGEGEEFIRSLLAAGANPNSITTARLKPIEHAASARNLDGVTILFPVTLRIPDYPDWSIHGIMNYFHSNKARMQREEARSAYFKLVDQRGKNAVKRRDYSSAVKWYSEAIYLDPSNARMRSNRSLCWANLQEATFALYDAEACVRLTPNWPKAHYREGAAWMLLKNYMMASGAFAKACRLDPRNAEADMAYKFALSYAAAELFVTCPLEMLDIFETVGV